MINYISAAAAAGCLFYQELYSTAARGHDTWASLCRGARGGGEEERERCANLMLQPRVLINLEECLRHRRMQFIYLCAWRARRGSDIRKKLFCYRASDELHRRRGFCYYLVCAENALCSFFLDNESNLSSFFACTRLDKEEMSWTLKFMTAGRCIFHQY
jgi:hypothetical protein